MNLNKRTLLFLLLVAMFPACPALALDPEEVVVIANSAVKDSPRLARYYMQQRGIPQDHLLLVHTTEREVISRQQYNEEIHDPVRSFLLQASGKPRISCLVTLYGLPLKIQPTAGENKEATATTRAAVDSELALVLAGEYPLEGWQANPYFLGFQHTRLPLKRDQVLLVSRLDGPDPTTVERIINDSLAVEHGGLRGRACFDARWPRPEEKKLSGYALYDNAIHQAAQLVRQWGRMEVQLDQRPQLFQAGDCPDTALYCGWYSLAKYVDAFSWARGAVGYHIASGECATLHSKNSRAWCPQMLSHGIAATIGPVYEPYVQAFPRPDLFFGTLVQGYLGLGETYLVSLPYLSWQMVLIGDPLYQPFLPDNKEKTP